MADKEKAIRDNYTERIPLFMAANEKSRNAGSGSFETAVTKCEKAIHLHSIKRRPVVKGQKRRSPKMKAYLSRKEFNPFLKNAWLLMGKAQFQKGDFLEAASTFSYISRHYAPEPDVVAESRIWLARCYAQMEWFYDAEDALSKLGKDSLPSRMQRENDATMADLLLREGRTEEALPYLKKTAKKERRKLPRARLYFLLGQVETELGHTQGAYKAYGKCLAQNPPYDLAFNARIRQTEVIASEGKAKKMLARLKRMGRSLNNKEYLDQVYYAMGNIYMTQKDTAHAVGAYEKGREKSTRNGIEKGVLLLRLGEIYWDMGRYDRAQGCYGEAVGLVGNEYEGYEMIARRSRILDELVPHTSAIQLQDSLLALSVASEEDRNAAIDRVIKELEMQEETARKAKADSIAEARRNAGGTGGNGNRNNQNNQNNQNQQSKGEWYFYNPMMVQQGKTAFQQQWGKRKNEDNWRRSNRTVLATDGNDEEYDYAAEDSMAVAQGDSTLVADVSDSVAVDSAAQDPHKREYYLAQIPFSEEAKAAAHAVIQEGLYAAGVIEKDKLEDFPLAARTLGRLEREYPDFSRREELFYQLFLLYSRWGKPEEANVWRNRMAQDFAGKALTRMVTDPDFEYKARYGKAIEDSLYTAAYEAYRRKDASMVETLYRRSEKEYPKGANRPKFIFVHALNRIGTASDKEVCEELRHLVKEYPESDVSELAGMMVKGLEGGRRFSSAGFAPGDLWNRRTATANAAVDQAGRMKTFTDAREVPFVCLIAYPTDSLKDGKVLYELAHFNFTGFLLRNFEIGLERDPYITQFRVTGFSSFDEAHAYARQLYTVPSLVVHLKQARVFLISEENMELLGTTYSFDDYAAFYEKTFAPLQINPSLPLDFNEGPVEQHYEDEYTPEELDRINNGNDDAEDSGDDDGWYTP